MVPLVPVAGTGRCASPTAAVRRRDVSSHPPCSRAREASSVRTLVWFRGKDLRIADHEPLSTAAANGEVLPLFVLDPYFFLPERARELPHRIQFLLESLRALEQNLSARGTRLLV